MWSRVLGLSNDKQGDSSPGSKNRKEEQPPQRKRSETTSSSKSSRKPPKDEERDRGFNPTSTSFSSSSRSQHPGAASASVASSYATAPSNSVDAPIAPPDLVRNASLANQMLKSKGSRDERDRGGEHGEKSGRGRDRPSSPDRNGDRQKRSRSRDRDERRRERKERREKKGDRNGGTERGLDKSENDYKGTSRAGEIPGSGGSFNTQIGAPNFTPFPGQYDGAVLGPASDLPHRPVMSDHVPDQFPGMFPSGSTAPYRPPLSMEQGGPGLAADYYGDAGESVAHQPGVRPQAPLLIVNAQPHLSAASPIEAPPIEPSATGGVGAAASFFSSASFESPSQSPRPSQQSARPTGPPSQSSGIARPGTFAIPAALAGSAAVGYMASSHGASSTDIRPPTNTVPGPPQNAGAAPPFNPPQPGPVPIKNNYHSSSAPIIPTLGSAAIGAAAGYMMGSHESQSQQPNLPQTSGITSDYRPHEAQHPPPQPALSQGSYPSYAPPPQSGKPLSPPSNLPIYAAGALGAAGLAAAAYHHEHQSSTQNLPTGQSYSSTTMAQQHRHHGPLDKFVEFFKDTEGVGRFEEYTEYIGVCRYCFEPGSSSRDAPRKHYYRKRRSNERLGGSMRVDKESRYGLSDGESRRKNNDSWLGTGLAGYGLAKVGKTLFGSERDTDDGYSARTGRVNHPATALNGRGYSNSPTRGSSTSYGIVRKSSDIKSSHRSRSRSSDRKTGLAEVVVGAAIGSSLLASSSQSKRKEREPRQSPAGFVKYSNASKEQIGIFGDSFTSPPEKRRSSQKRSKAKPKGFFTFGNSSSSSTDLALAGGTESDRSRRKRSSKSRIKDHNDASAALIGLGAATAALAAAEGRKGEKSKRRADVVAINGVRSNGRRNYERPLSERDGHKYSTPAVEEEMWVSASEENGYSSADSMLAYGYSRRSSRESLSSDSSGTNKWNWRWGGKPKKGKHALKEDLEAAAGLAGVAAGSTLLSREDHKQPATSRPGSLPPLQHVYPISTPDPSHYDVTLRDSITSTSQPLKTSRPASIPLQQPQPIALVSSGVYSSQAPYVQTSRTITGLPIISQQPQPPSYSTGYGEPSPVPYPPTSISRDDVPEQRPRRRDTSPGPEVVHIESRAPRRSSTRDDISSVRFDITQEQEDAKRKSERRERTKSDPSQRDEYRETQDLIDGDERRRKSKKSSRVEKYEKKGREEEIDEKLKRLRKEEALSSQRKNKDSWAVPVLAGVAGAVVGAASAGEFSKTDDRRKREREQSSEGRDQLEEVVHEETQGDSHVESSEQKRTEQRQAAIAQRAAEKVRRTPSPSNHRGYADFFAPTDLLSKTKDVTRSDDVNGGNDITAFSVPQSIANELAERGTISGVQYPLTGDEKGKHDPNLMRLPWQVPLLKLIEPTPPASMAGSMRGDSSPVMRPEDAHISDDEESANVPARVKVTSDDSETRKYEVTTPMEHGDEFVSSNHGSYDNGEKMSGPYDKSQTKPISTGSPVAEITRDHMPGAFSDDIDFAATLAAGLQDSGFDPAIVIDNPTYRRRDSPPRSEQVGFYRRPFFDTVTDLALDAPGTDEASPVRGYVEGEIPQTPRDEIKPLVAESHTHEAREQVINRDEKAEKVTKIKEDLIPLSIKSRGPLKGAEAANMVHQFHEPEIIEAVPRGIPRSSSVGGERKVQDPQTPSILSQVAIHDDASESQRDIQKDADIVVAQGVLSEEPLPLDNRSGSTAISKPEVSYETTISKEDRDEYDSANDFASTAATEPLPNDFDEPKRLQRRSKRKSSGYEPSASTASSPAKFDDTKEANGKAKKDKKVAIFSIFSKSTKPIGDDSQENNKEMARENVEEPKRKGSKKSKDRKSKRDSDGLYSQPSEASTDLSRFEDDGANRKIPNLEYKEERRKGRKESKASDDLGRATHELPAKNLSTQDDELDLISEYEGDDDPGEGSSRSISKDEPLSFLGVRREETEPPDITDFADPGGHIRTLSEETAIWDALSTKIIGESLPPLPPSRPTTPTAVGSLNDLPPLPTSRPASPAMTPSGQPRRLSMLQQSESNSPLASPSPTAVPLMFRRFPSSTSVSRSTPSTPGMSPHGPALMSPRQRQSRPLSTEYKSSKEFLPLWLVERHDPSRRKQAPEEVYPSLPSSHSTSRASSVHDLEHEDHDDVFDHEAIDQDLLQRQLEYRQDFLDSQQPTPTRSSFQFDQATERARQSAFLESHMQQFDFDSPLFTYGWEDVRELPTLPQSRESSPYDPQSSHAIPSAIADLAAGTFTGAAVTTAAESLDRHQDHEPSEELLASLGTVGSKPRSTHHLEDGEHLTTDVEVSKSFVATEPGNLVAENKKVLVDRPVSNQADTIEDTPVEWSAPLSSTKSKKDKKVKGKIRKEPTPEVLDRRGLPQRPEDIVDPGFLEESENFEAADDDVTTSKSSKKAKKGKMGKSKSGSVTQAVNRDVDELAQVPVNRSIETPKDLETPETQDIKTPADVSIEDWSAPSVTKKGKKDKKKKGKNSWSVTPEELPDQSTAQPEQGRDISNNAVYRDTEQATSVPLDIARKYSEPKYSSEDRGSLGSVHAVGSAAVAGAVALEQYESAKESDLLRDNKDELEPLFSTTSKKAKKQKGKKLNLALGQGASYDSSEGRAPFVLANNAQIVENETSTGDENLLLTETLNDEIEENLRAVEDAETPSGGTINICYHPVVVPEDPILSQNVELRGPMKPETARDIHRIQQEYRESEPVVEEHTPANISLPRDDDLDLLPTLPTSPVLEPEVPHDFRNEAYAPENLGTLPVDSIDTLTSEPEASREHVFKMSKHAHAGQPPMDARKVPPALLKSQNLELNESRILDHREAQPAELNFPQDLDLDLLLALPSSPTLEPTTFYESEYKAAQPTESDLPQDLNLDLLPALPSSPVVEPESSYDVDHDEHHVEFADASTSQEYAIAAASHSNPVTQNSTQRDTAFTEVSLRKEPDAGVEEEPFPKTSASESIDSHEQPIERGGADIPEPGEDTDYVPVSTTKRGENGKKNRQSQPVASLAESLLKEKQAAQQLNEAPDSSRDPYSEEALLELTARGKEKFELKRQSSPRKKGKKQKSVWEEYGPEEPHSQASESMRDLSARAIDNGSPDTSPEHETSTMQEPEPSEKTESETFAPTIQSLQTATEPKEHEYTISAIFAATNTAEEVRNMLANPDYMTVTDSNLHPASASEDQSHKSANTMDADERLISRSIPGKVPREQALAKETLPMRDASIPINTAVEESDEVLDIPMTKKGKKNKRKALSRSESSYQSAVATLEPKPKNARTTEPSPLRGGPPSSDDALPIEAANVAFPEEIIEDISINEKLATSLPEHGAALSILDDAADIILPRSDDDDLIVPEDSVVELLETRDRAMPINEIPTAPTLTESSDYFAESHERVQIPAFESSLLDEASRLTLPTDDDYDLIEGEQTVTIPTSDCRPDSDDLVAGILTSTVKESPSHHPQQFSRSVDEVESLDATRNDGLESQGYLHDIIADRRSAEDVSHAFGTASRSTPNAVETRTPNPENTSTNTGLAHGQQVESQEHLFPEIDFLDEALQTPLPADELDGYFDTKDSEEERSFNHPSQTQVLSDELYGSHLPIVGPLETSEAKELDDSTEDPAMFEIAPSRKKSKKDKRRSKAAAADHDEGDPELVPEEKTVTEQGDIRDVAQADTQNDFTRDGTVIGDDDARFSSPKKSKKDKRWNKSLPSERSEEIPPLSSQEQPVSEPAGSKDIPQDNIRALLTAGTSIAAFDEVDALDSMKSKKEKKRSKFSPSDWSEEPLLQGDQAPPEMKHTRSMEASQEAVKLSSVTELVAEDDEIFFPTTKYGRKDRKKGKKAQAFDWTEGSTRTSTPAIADPKPVPGQAGVAEIPITEAESTRLLADKADSENTEALSLKKSKKDKKKAKMGKSTTWDEPEQAPSAQESEASDKGRAVYGPADNPNLTNAPLERLPADTEPKSVPTEFVTLREEAADVIPKEPCSQEFEPNQGLDTVQASEPVRDLEPDQGAQDDHFVPFEIKKKKKGKKIKQASFSDLQLQGDEAVPREEGPSLANAEAPREIEYAEPYRIKPLETISEGIPSGVAAEEPPALAEDRQTEPPGSGYEQESTGNDGFVGFTRKKSKKGKKVKIAEPPKSSNPEVEIGVSSTAAILAELGLRPVNIEPEVIENVKPLGCPEEATKAIEEPPELNELVVAAAEGVHTGTTKRKKGNDNEKQQLLIWEDKTTAKAIAEMPMEAEQSIVEPSIRTSELLRDYPHGENTTHQGLDYQESDSLPAPESRGTIDRQMSHNTANWTMEQGGHMTSLPKNSSEKRYVLEPQERDIVSTPLLSHPFNENQVEGTNNERQNVQEDNHGLEASALYMVSVPKTTRSSELLSPEHAEEDSERLSRRRSWVGKKRKGEISSAGDRSPSSSSSRSLGLLPSDVEHEHARRRSSVSPSSRFLGLLPGDDEHAHTGDPAPVAPSKRSLGLLPGDVEHDPASYSGYQDRELAVEEGAILHREGERRERPSSMRESSELGFEEKTEIMEPTRHIESKEQHQGQYRGTMTMHIPEQTSSARASDLDTETTVRRDVSQEEHGPISTIAKPNSKSIEGAAATASAVGAGIALFENIHRRGSVPGTDKSKKRRSSGWNGSEEPAREDSSFQQTEAVRDMPHEVPMASPLPPHLVHDINRNRDSAVHVSDSPLSGEYAPFRQSIRDSGYQGTDASPTFPETPERSDSFRKDRVSRDSFKHEKSPRGTLDRHSGSTTFESSNRSSLENPLNISIEVDPAYEVSVSRPEHDNENQHVHTEVHDRDSGEQLPVHYHEHSQDRSMSPTGGERRPSPVDSTTKTRSSELFESSPSTREDFSRSRAQQHRASPSPEVDGHHRDFGTSRNINDFTTPTKLATQQEQLHAKTVETTHATNSSLFGGPIGINSDLQSLSPPPRTPASSGRRQLDTIDERGLDQVPSHKHTRATSDVGLPEHSLKTVRQSGTPQGISHQRMRSPLAEPTGDKGLVSVEELDSRLSWPAVDEDTQSVDLERSKSRKAEGERRLSSRQSPLSVAATDIGKHHEAEYRSVSGASIRSGESISAIIKSPDLRSPATPPLRRVDRSVSSDLRAANKRSEAKKGAKLPESDLDVEPVIASSSTYDPVNDKGKGRITKMNEVYEGWGDVHDSPRSPTRPASMRKRQSMQFIEMQTRLDQLASENRSLIDAKARVESSLDQSLHNQKELEDAVAKTIETRDFYLKEKDNELNELRRIVEGLHNEVSRLTEINEGFQGTSRGIEEHEQKYSQLESEHSDVHQRWQDTTRELDELKNKHASLSGGMEGIVRHEVELALQSKNAELMQMREELEAAKEQVRILQQQILASRSSDDVLVARDEDYFDSQCQQLCQHVQQWVLRFSKFSDSKICHSVNDIADEKITDRFDNAILDGSDVDIYLKDRVKRRDVFMSVVMTMVWEYIFSRYLFGMDREQRQKLKYLEKTLSEVGPPMAVNKWRATTLTMLSKREAFQNQRQDDTEAVVQEIYNTLAILLTPPPHLVQPCIDSLRKVMAAAVDLSVEMRTQRAEYNMLPPLQPEYDTNGELARNVYFNAALMNERSGDTTSNEELAARQAVVRMVLFPLVVKKGDDEGVVGEDIVVCPAQVLIARDREERREGKKSVRVMSAQGERMEGVMGVGSTALGSGVDAPGMGGRF